MPEQAPAPLPDPTPFTRIGAWVADRPRAVVAAFAVLLAISAVYGASVGQRLPAGGFDVPGSDSFRLSEISEQRLGLGKPDLVLLYRRTDGGDMKTRDSRRARLGCARSRARRRGRARRDQLLRHQPRRAGVARRPPRAGAAEPGRQRVAQGRRVPAPRARAARQRSRSSPSRSAATSPPRRSRSRSRRRTFARRSRSRCRSRRCSCSSSSGAWWPVCCPC